MLQGCPLSGAFFAAAVDAILRHLSSIADVPLRTRVARNRPFRSGIIAACADVVGGAFASLRILIPLRGASGTAERVPNLKINPIKSVIVPVHVQPTPRLCQRISELI